MDALALLRLQIEWGADEALDDAPVDRLRAPPPAHAPASPHPDRTGAPPLPDRIAARPAPGQRHAAPAPAANQPSGTPAERAAAVAAQAQTIEALRAALAAFDGCALRDTASNLVFAAGDPVTGLLLIGDPPGDQEDRSGQPFAGPAGILLDRMLASIGLTRAGLLCTPLIPWRPPGGRLPSPGEIAVCLPFLHRLIALAQPRRVILGGVLASRALLGPTRRRGRPAWTEMSVPGLAAPVAALVMPSPAMVARDASARREAWAALRMLRHALDADLAEK